MTAPDPALITSANNTQQSGQTFSPEVTNALQTAYGSAAAAATATNTPETRQAILNSTGISALQNNYSDLAQKLAGYDQAILKPQFAGTDPGATTASDMPAGFSPMTTMSGLSMNNADTQPASSAIFNTNPVYGFQAQKNQADNILGLLGTLNDAISKEYGRGSKEYATKLSTATTAMAGLSHLLDQNTNIEINKAQMENALKVAGIQSGASVRAALIQAGFVDENGNPLIPGVGGSGTSGQSPFYGPPNPATGQIDGMNNTSTSSQDERTAAQARYRKYPPQSTAAMKILTQWNDTHSIPLFPKPLNGTDLEALQNSATSLNAIDEATSAISKMKDSEFGLIGGNYNNALANSSFKSKLSSDAATAAAAFARIKGLGTKLLVGGRDTGYLIDQFGAAFPGFTMSKQQILDRLQNARTYVTLPLAASSTNLGYDNPQALLDSYGLKNIKYDNGSGGSGIITQSDGTSWRQNPDGTYTRTK